MTTKSLILGKKWVFDEYLFDEITVYDCSMNCFMLLEIMVFDEIYACCKFMLFRLYNFITNLIGVQIDRNLDLQLTINKSLFLRKPSKILAIMEHDVRNRELYYFLWCFKQL